MEWRKPKKIYESGKCKFEHGVTLFVEENDPKKDFNSFKWKIEFERESEKVTVHINDLNYPDAIDFPIKVCVTRNETVK